MAAGLALGSLGYYGYGYPYYGAAYGGDCYLVSRRLIDPWGRVITRRVYACDS